MASTSTSCRAYDDDNGSSSRRARVHGAAEAPSRQPSHLAKGKRLRNGRVPRAHQVGHVRVDDSCRAYDDDNGSSSRRARADGAAEAPSRQPSHLAKGKRLRNGRVPRAHQDGHVRVDDSCRAYDDDNGSSSRRARADGAAEAPSPRTSRRAGAKEDPARLVGTSRTRDGAYARGVQQPCVTRRQRLQLARDRRGEQTGTRAGARISQGLRPCRPRSEGGRAANMRGSRTNAVRHHDDSGVRRRHTTTTAARARGARRSSRSRGAAVPHREQGAATAARARGCSPRRPARSPCVIVTTAAVRAS